MQRVTKNNYFNQQRQQKEQNQNQTIKITFKIFYLSLKYFTKSQIIIGRFSLSLYVGKRTEYLFLSAIFSEGEGHSGGLIKLRLDYRIISKIREIFSSNYNIYLL